LNIQLEVRSIDGEVLQRQQLHNDVVRGGWNMWAALRASNGAYTFKINKMLAGSGTRAVSVSDAALAAPWAGMSYITAGRATRNATTLVHDYGILPNTQTGKYLAELGFYYDINTGSSPIVVPALYSRALVPSPFTVLADQGVYISHIKGWTN
jgi:hypothetical protein